MLCKKCYQAQGRVDLEDRHPWDHCHHEEEKTYPCIDCGKLRTKEEGGNTFTVCDECWDKRHPKKEEKCWCEGEKEHKVSKQIWWQNRWTMGKYLYARFCPDCGRTMEAK